MPLLFVESCGQCLLFCTLVKALNAIRNKEVVRRASMVLCAFEAWCIDGCRFTLAIFYHIQVLVFFFSFFWMLKFWQNFIENFTNLAKIALEK